MESSVSNLATKFDDFKTSQYSHSLLGVVDSHERALESRVKNAETTLVHLQKEIKSNNDLILQMLQSLAARFGVGTHTDSKIREGLNPNLGPNFGRPDSCRTSNPPFIKMASHISVLKSDEIVLKLQAFHNEKVRAREKRDEFWSQFRPRYKPKTRPCLRPILKNFKKVRDYGKHDDDVENVFDLFDKEAKDSVEIPPFLDSDCKTVVPPILDSDCTTGTTNNLVSGFPVSACEFIGMEKQVATSKLLAKKDEDSLLSDVGLCSFPEGGSFPNMVLILVAQSGENDALHVYVGRQQTTDIVSLKFGFHELILDKGGTIIQRLLNSKSIGKVESIFVQEHVSAHLLDALQPFGGFYNDAIVSVSFQFTYHKGIRDKGGTVCLSEFNSMDLLAIWELGFTLTAENRIFSEEIDLLLVPADQTRIALQVFDERSHSADGDFQLGYHIPISDTGGTLCWVFTSNVQIKDAHSSKFFVMIIDGEDAGYLGLHHLEACLAKNRKHGSKFTFSRFETSFCVVVHCDMCYCKGIRDKGGGSKFRKSTGDEEKMVNLYFTRIGLPSSLPTNEDSFVKNVLQKKKMAMDEFLMSEKLTLRPRVEEFIDLSLYTQLVNDTGLSSVVDEQLVKEVIQAVSAEKQRMGKKVASMLQLSVDWRWVLKGQALKLSSFADQILSFKPCCKAHFMGENQERK